MEHAFSFCALEVCMRNLNSSPFKTPSENIEMEKLTYFNREGGGEERYTIFSFRISFAQNVQKCLKREACWIYEIFKEQSLPPCDGIENRRKADYPDTGHCVFGFPWPRFCRCFCPRNHNTKPLGEYPSQRYVFFC